MERTEMNADKTQLLGLGIQQQLLLLFFLAPQY